MQIDDVRNLRPVATSDGGQVPAHDPATTDQGNAMNTHYARTLMIAAAMSVTALATLPAHAQDVRREDMVTYFNMDKIDKDKDGMVSRKEFLDMMSKAWDMQMAAHPEVKDKGKMTLEQYKAFAKMFNLDVGA
jgi:hypothetical protein